MKLLMLIGLCAVLGGCGSMSEEELDAHYKRMAAVTELQIELTNNCIKLAATIERQGDDDVADIIEECRYNTYSMASRLTPR